MARAALRRYRAVACLLAADGASEISLRRQKDIVQVRRTGAFWDRGLRSPACDRRCGLRSRTATGGWWFRRVSLDRRNAGGSLAHLRIAAESFGRLLRVSGA